MRDRIQARVFVHVNAVFRPPPMTVDVAEVRKLLARRREINRVPLAQILWTENGKALDVPPAWVAEFAATGLSNTCFVDLDVYRDGLRDLHVGAK